MAEVYFPPLASNADIDYDSLRQWLAQQTVSVQRLLAGTIQSEEIILADGGTIGSAGFTAGSVGWRIDGDGSAEFNNVTVRGAVFATSGTLGTMTVTGDLTVSGDINMASGTGTIRSGTGTTRVEILSAFTDRINFIYSGATGYIAGTTGNSLQLVPPGGTVALSVYGTYVQTVKQLQATTGTAGSPGISFTSGTDTGLRLSGTSDSVTIVAGGVDQVDIISTGLSPSADNTQTLGHSGRKWDEIWARTTTISTSDIREKRNVRSLSVPALDMVSAVSPVEFRFNDGVRQHYGFSAQDVGSYMRGKGLDWGAYVDPKVNDPSSVDPKGLRSGELLPVLWQAVKELKAQVDAL